MNRVQRVELAFYDKYRNIFVSGVNSLRRSRTG